MKRNALLTATVLFALISSLLPAASAAIKVGGTCTKLNTTTTVAGLKYICTKTGKKLVWSKGVKVIVESAKEISTPSVIATPTPSPAQSSAPAIPASIEDLYKYRHGIAYAAWSKMAVTTKNSAPKLPPIEIYRGPNTPNYVQSPGSAIEFVAKLLPGSELPKKIVIIYWSHADIAWGAAKAKELMGAENESKYLAFAGGPFADCYTPVSCQVGHAYVPDDGTAYIGLGIPDNLSDGGGNDLVDIPQGQREAIEFYHSLQLYPYFRNKSPITNKNNKTSANYPPAWLNLAGENFVFETLKNQSNLPAFEKSQDNSGWMSNIANPFTLDWLHNFLSIKNLNGTWSDDGYESGRINTCMGASLVEIFVALKGPTILLTFHDQMSQGRTFNEVFASEFGMTWEKAEPEIAKVIYDKFLNFY